MTRGCCNNHEPVQVIVHFCQLIDRSRYKPLLTMLAIKTGVFMSRKINFFFLLFLCLANLLFSLHSDDYPIGIYSHYQNLDAVDINQFSTLLGSANYNIITAKGITENEISLFNTEGIDVVYNDQLIKNATKANYWEYEAEYHTDNFDPNEYNPQIEFTDRYTGNDAWVDEMWFYSVKRDIPEIYISNEQNSSESKYHIKCMDSLEEGYIMDTYTYHCVDEPLIDQISTNYISYDYDYDYVFKFTMKVPQGSYTDPTTEICKVGLKLYREDQAENLGYELIQFDGENSDLITLTFQDFVNANAIGDNFATFEYTISRGNLNSYHNTGKPRAKLSPVIWYCDNGPLEVDNVIITDTIYDDLDNPNSELRIALNDSINNLLSYSNVVSLAAVDEPKRPQYNSFEKVRSIIDNRSKLQSCVNLPGWKYSDENGFPLHNATKAFSQIANPTQILTDVYPSNVYMKWGIIDSCDEWYTFQGRINKMNELYSDTKNECIDKEIPFYPMTQTFGEKCAPSGTTDYVWDKYLLPPNETQSLLSFIPLCYGADGIYNFEFENFYTPDDPTRNSSNEIIHPEIERDRSTNFFHVGLVNDFGDGLQTIPQYYVVKAANEKISVIGSIIKELTWDEYRTTTLMPTPTSFTVNTALSNNVSMSAYDPTGIIGDSGNQHTEYEENYEGYVECSIYSGDSDYFMLVNRRANFPLDIFTLTNNFLDRYNVNFPEYDINQAFAIADLQVVHFEFANYNLSNYALVDQYTFECFDDFTYGNVAEIDIPINPGECRMLKLVEVSSLSDVISTISIANCTINNNITICNSGVLNIDNNVTITANAIIEIEAGGVLNINGENFTVGTDAVITVNNNATLNITCDNGTIGDDSEISVLSGGIANINGNLEFGSNSKISNYGDLVIGENSSSQLTARSAEWLGIRSFPESSTSIEGNTLLQDAEVGISARNCDVSISNSTIKHCERSIYIYNHPYETAPCNLEFLSSTLILNNSATAIGIDIRNSNINNDFLISEGITGRSSIVGHNNNGVGIKISTNNSGTPYDFICEKISFTNLDKGILIEPYRSTSHKLENCNFSNCSTGVQLLGNGRIFHISDCSFYSNSVGISQNTSLTNIISCDFDENLIGIDLANITSSRNTSDSFVIDNCNFNFYNNNQIFDFGIRCTDASPNITGCLFENDFGLVSVDKSLVDLAYSSNNVFMSSTSHLRFLATNELYSSGILLKLGHNDFYENSQYDFWFDGHDYNGSRIDIDANGNYRERASFNLFDFFIINPPNIIEDHMDPNPNNLVSSPPTNRFQTAFSNENNDALEIAYIQYKEILNDLVEPEKDLWAKTLDRLYNLSFNYETEESIRIYFEGLLANIPSFLTQKEQDSMKFLINNYIKKSFIASKDYQQAADIVLERINNPISSVDSLFAVMQLETIYVLSEKDSLNRSAKVNTKLNHIAPKSITDFDNKQKSHWKEIYQLLGIAVEEDEENYEQVIPTVPTLYTNYPNPFNPETTIAFSIPEDSEAKISIYNIKGQKVKDLINEHLEKGNHNVVWYSKDNSGKSVASGVYFYQLEVNGKTQGIKKCLLLK